MTMNEINSKPENEKPLWAYRHAGVDARRYRGQIALIAKSQKPTMRTLQFPLDGSPEISSSDLIGLYNVIEGVELGSIFTFWASLHLAGFRFFAAAGDAANFRQLSVFNDAYWNSQFCASSNLNYEWLKPSALYSALQKNVRAMAGKDVSFNPETVSNELAKRLLGKSLVNSKNESNYPVDVVEFLNELGKAVCSSASSWREVNTDPAIALTKIDLLLKEKGYMAPSLVSIASKLGKLEPVGATIAHVRKSHKSNQFTMQTIYSLIANQMGEGQTNVTSWVQTEAVTQNASALSWIFSKGIQYFVNTPLDKILSDFQIEPDTENIEGIQHVIKSAQAIPNITLFGQKHYSYFRANFAGKVTSWIANYGNRIEELNAIIQEILPIELPSKIETVEAKIFFHGTDSTPSSLSEQILSVQSKTDSLKTYLNILIGKSTDDIESACVKIAEFSDVIDSLGGQLRALKTNIERQRDIAIGTGNSALLSLCTECAFDVPKWLKPLPKLNAFSGGIPNIQQEVGNNTKIYESLWLHWRKFTNELVDFSGNKFDIYDRVAEREASLIKQINPKLHEVRGDRRARRNIVNRIGRMIQNCSEETKILCVGQWNALGLFENKKNLNTWIFNQKGRVYASPLDKSKHGTYALNDNVLMNTDWIDWLTSFTEVIKQSNYKAAHEDLQTLEVGKQSLVISGLPDIKYPDDMVSRIVQFIGDYAEIPRSLRLLIEKGDVHVSSLQKLLNIFSSAIKGKSFAVFRSSFLVKLRFAIGGDNSLLYVPKNKTWRAPEQLLKSDLPIGMAARYLAEQGLLNELTLKQIQALQKSDLPERALQEWLVQSPHDWYYSPLVPGEEPVKAIKVSKNIGNLYQLRSDSGLRLVGNSAYKSVIDRAILDKTSLSDMSIVVNLNYEQTTKRTNDGYVTTIRELPLQWQVSIPLTEERDVKNESVEIFDRIVAFDLGEYGLGYACYDIKTKMKLDSGYKSVSAIKRMMRRVWQYEHRPNIRTKFQAKFNISMSSLRDNVVGDICSQINRICDYYRAFPVFESSIGDTGNKQLNSVYEAILTRYLYSGVSAHQNERRQYWLGADSWSHPYLKTPEFKDGAPTKNFKPLTIFPGASVSGKGTSQRCSCCKRNPYELLEKFKETDKLAVLNGKVTVDGSTFELRERNTDYEALRKARSLNQRAPLQLLVENGNLTVKEIRRVLKTSLRQAPLSRQSKNSSVSQYHCVFVDCLKSMKADENAGVNIADKFLNEKAFA